MTESHDCCPCIDALRALVAEYRAESNETWTAIRAERDALAAKVAAVEALADRIYTEAQGFEPVSNDGDVAMGTRMHMMSLVRAAISGPVDDA